MSRSKTPKIVNPERLDPEFGTLGMATMSWSRAETYDDRWSTFACPRKYKFKYCDKKIEGWTIHLAIGSAVHETLEWAISNAVEDATELSAYYAQSVRRNDPDNKMTDSEIQDGFRLVTQTFDHMMGLLDGNVSRVIDIEWGFRFIIGRGLFVGFIDLVYWDTDENGKFIHVVDYKTSAMDKKTGKPKKKTKDHGQLALYTLAVRHRFPNERIKASLYWLKAPVDADYRMDTHEFTTKELETFEKNMKKTVENIIDDENFQVTKKIFVCAYCSFNTEDLCKYGFKCAQRFKTFSRKKK